MLTDNYNRTHNYLRISLTDACNFRCTYCMPNEDMLFTPAQHLMQTHEIIKLAHFFVQQGIDKIRLTGGEPLIRKDFDAIVTALSKLGITLTLTTNARLLHHHLFHLINSGVKSINISLDTLKPDRFLKITRRNDFEKVKANIFLCLEQAIRVKINVVLMHGINDDEILDFIRLTKHHPLHVRFIEFMPFDGNQWQADKVITHYEIIAKAQQTFDIIKMKDAVN
ncbi:MAG TPA: radical SAM protein, partial [Bacteroidia bacterium]|nr:radical SAM protein [Bacteroidia bacterium]